MTFKITNPEKTKSSEGEAKHPCFDIEAKGKYGRVHLPIAPKCNIQCNYCNRDYDCVNESRPGVTSTLLEPFQALEYMKNLTAKYDNITVAGIAGPGDAFAQPEVVFETLKGMKEELPHLIPCLSTNGLDVMPYIDDLEKYKVKHITLTINAIDVDVMAKIYSWVRFDKKTYRGRQAAELMHKNQMAALEALGKGNFVVKVNMVIIPGINDHEVEAVAKVAAQYGADVMNLIPIKPVKGTPFENEREPSHAELAELKKIVAKYLKPMTHCARCRADAAGLLGKDLTDTADMLSYYANLKIGRAAQNKKVAVASNEGIMVNLHLGEAPFFHIFEEENGRYKFIEQRTAPQTGTGDERWIRLGEIISDCRGLLVAGIGTKPMDILSKKFGLQVIEMTGLIEEGLDGIFNGKEIRSLNRTDMQQCGTACTGKGLGCCG
ncbi:MAG: radical SAM protein [Prolixibacteraceae bacterium]